MRDEDHALCKTFARKLSIPEHCFSGFLHIHELKKWESGKGRR